MSHLSGIRHIDLAEEPESARAARSFARTTLQEWGHTAVEADVCLAVSELVTNAVVHAHSPASLTLIDSVDVVQVRVRDEEPMPPQTLNPSSTDTHGRGMNLVEALGTRWGVEPALPGKIVWLDVPKH